MHERDEKCIQNFNMVISLWFCKRQQVYWPARLRIIKVDLKEVEWESMDWIHLSQSLVNMVISLWFCKRQQIYWPAKWLGFVERKRWFCEYVHAHVHTVTQRAIAESVKWLILDWCYFYQRFLLCRTVPCV
jgi:hypothetical protein